ncbi:MAG: 8-hydroxy-5-deazaflavin:NADPH oxidoreductase [Streptomyces sp.]|nr:8-hydroxy-5-deazaflavin:NADPH oxidoreductase [Streptomyces sp.]
MPSDLLDENRWASAQATPPVFLAGHDPLAKAKVARLAEDAGFAALDTGPLVAARSIEQLGVVLHHVGENRLGQGVHDLTLGWTARLAGNYSATSTNQRWWAGTSLHLDNSPPSDR